MSFGLRVHAADVDWQIRYLKLFPELSDKHFRPAMRKAVANLGNRIESDVPLGASGKARSTFKMTVSGKGLSLKGRVGWWYASDPWYVNVLEYGAKPHSIQPKGKSGAKMLRFNAGGATIFTRVVLHPGFPAMHFMRRAETTTRPSNDQEFERARDRVVNDLTVKA